MRHGLSGDDVMALSAGTTKCNRVPDDVAGDSIISYRIRRKIQPGEPRSAARRQRSTRQTKRRLSR